MTTIPKLIVVNGKTLPMTKLQEAFFDENGMDSLLDYDEEPETGLDSSFDDDGAPF